MVCCFFVAPLDVVVVAAAAVILVVRPPAMNVFESTAVARNDMKCEEEEELFEDFKKIRGRRGENLSISGFTISREENTDARTMQNVDKNAASRDHSAFEIVELREEEEEEEEEEEAKRRGQKPKASSENKNTRRLGFLEEKLLYPFRFARVVVFFVLFKIIALVLSGFTWIPILLPINGYYDERKAAKAAGIEVEALPKIPRFSELKLKLCCWLFVVFGVDVPAKWVQKAYAKYEEVNKDTPEARTQPIPTFDASSPDFDFDAFYRDYVERPHPAVLKGFNKNIPAIKNGWGVDWLIENYGHERALMKTLERDNVSGYIRDLNNPGTYLHNSEAIFDNHPELIDDLNLDRLKVFCGNGRISNDDKGYGRLPIQFFTGRAGTGSAFHCANAYNFFLQIEGRKRWSFVDPKWTFLLYPSVNRSAAYHGFAVKDPNTVYPTYERLWKICPRFSTILEEGDVLLNPPWWIHCIENLDSNTTAVATRWVDCKTFNPTTGLGSSANRLFTMFQVFAPAYNKYAFYTLLNGGRNKVLPADEHTDMEAAYKPKSFETFSRASQASYDNREQDYHRAFYAKKWGFEDIVRETKI